MVATRKGATSPDKVPKAILRQIEAGTMQTASLSEALAIDFGRLLANSVPQIGPSHRKTIDPKAGITKRMQVVATLIHENCEPNTFESLKLHESDTVRGWAAYVLAATPGLSLKQRLAKIKPLANDPHFAVREWAQLALRPAIARDLDSAIEILTPWVRQKSPRIRRFAVEATRPRGVWCVHHAALKSDPSPGLALLEPLRSDTDRYVQDSIANWLNDAAKTNPEWVQRLCVRWLREDKGPDTQYICRRARRSFH